MLKVEKELKFLKNKQTEQKGKLMGDDEITNLQRSIKWFKLAAIKLNEKKLEVHFGPKGREVLHHVGRTADALLFAVERAVGLLPSSVAEASRPS